ncbi:uncharacterized protein [Rutidosis leptorrhynchoides]|uniref:uncharacterized protein n=1 Tax=Rutidosis leptorrhynchoides TaxID=125765 RepID=UPI003A995F32
MGLCDFWPISLIGSYYKIISKILANRLRKVINKIVGPEQSAFIKGRQILDGISVANEIIEDLKRAKKKCLIFKADFAKAFDSLDWHFLDSTMNAMGFGTKWREWIKECLRTASISILVNGTATKEFYLEKGASGLKVNFSKSNLFSVGVSSDAVSDMARYLGCATCVIPFTYLGVLVGCEMKKRKDWDFVVDKVKHRLSDCKEKSLSFGGCITLIKSVLSSLPLYAFCLFCAPSSVINLLEGLRRNFLWGGSGDNTNMAWTREPRGRTVNELQQIERDLSGYCFGNQGKDTWKWELHGSGIYTTGAMSDLIDEKRVADHGSNLEPTLRNKLLP